MEENIYYSSLFDIYSNLLTEKQKKYFKEYYFENLLLDEISENENITKNAVSKEIKRAKELLDYYEKELSLYKKRKIIKGKLCNDPNILSKIEDYI